jgi:hypothetical protein
LKVASSGNTAEDLSCALDRANAATNPPTIGRCNLENALRQLEQQTPWRVFS